MNTVISVHNRGVEDVPVLHAEVARRTHFGFAVVVTRDDFSLRRRCARGRRFSFLVASVHAAVLAVFDPLVRARLPLRGGARARGEVVVGALGHGRCRRRRFREGAAAQFIADVLEEVADFSEKIFHRVVCVRRIVTSRRSWPSRGHPKSYS